MKYIASCSFGKDSLAMILTILQHNLPLDEVVYVEVMYDETLSGEYPAHAAFIYDTAIPYLKNLGIKVTVLRSNTTYKKECTRLRTKGRWQGLPVGFPSLWAPWCNGVLKRRPLQKYMREQTDEVHEYVGIAADEPKRLERLLEKPGKSAPLAELGITEAEAKAICEAHGLLSPIYDTKDRNGCWMCHNGRMCDLKDIYQNHPDLWQELRFLQSISDNSFTKRYNIFDLEKKFDAEK